MAQFSQIVTAGADLEAVIHPGATWPIPQAPLLAYSQPTHIPEFFVSSGMFKDEMAGVADNSHSCASHYDFSRPNLENSTCWEVLTVRLGRFVREQMQAGIYPSDELIQGEARRILFESDDTWNQTAADNPEWLDLFKKAHGLSDIPMTTAEQGLMVEDLGVTLEELNFDSFYTDSGYDGTTNASIRKQLIGN